MQDQSITTSRRRSIPYETYIGQDFNRLRVLDVIREPRKLPKFKCLCKCGKICIRNAKSVVAGRSRSCNCLKTESCIKHGKARIGRTTAEYRIWQAMINRCENPNSAHYKYYGGRGISVCKRWRENFADFLADMGLRPSDRYSLDRIDTNGNYEPSNCRWATDSEQMRNTHNNYNLTYEGKTMCAKDWAIERNLNYGTLLSRLAEGWDEIEALATPACAPGVKFRKRRPFKNGADPNRLRSGINHPLSKLTEDSVRAIRREYISGSPIYGAKALARKYGVSDFAIHCIVTKKTWKHLE